MSSPASPLVLYRPCGGGPPTFNPPCTRVVAFFPLAGLASDPLALCGEPFGDALDGEPFGDGFADPLLRRASRGGDCAR